MSVLYCHRLLLYRLWKPTGITRFAPLGYNGGSQTQPPLYSCAFIDCLPLVSYLCPLKGQRKFTRYTISPQNANSTIYNNYPFYRFEKCDPISFYPFGPRIIGPDIKSITHSHTERKEYYFSNFFSVCIIISTHSISCSLFITKGGANLIIFPCVGFAKRPLSLKAKQISHAVELSSVSFIKMAFNKPLPLIAFTILQVGIKLLSSSLNSTPN